MDAPINKRSNSLINKESSTGELDKNDDNLFSPLEIKHNEESKQSPKSANHISSESCSYSSSSSQSDYVNEDSEFNRRSSQRK